MTRPYTRACRQTNFSEGGFVNKVPFLFFYIFSFCYLLSVSFLNFLSFCPFFKWVHGQLGGPSDYTGEMGSQFYVNYLPKMIP